MGITTHLPNKDWGAERDVTSEDTLPQELGSNPGTASPSFRKPGFQAKTVGLFERWVGVMDREKESVGTKLPHNGDGSFWF